MPGRKRRAFQVDRTASAKVQRQEQQGSWSDREGVVGNEVGEKMQNQLTWVFLVLVRT
jgi:hypothetical protein